MRVALPLALSLSGACSFHASGNTPPGADAYVADADPFQDAPGPNDLPAARYRLITIPKANISGTLDDFPIYVELTLETGTASGDDIYFTKTDGTVMDFEFQRWAPTSHRLSAWVRITTLKSDADEKLFVHYGGPEIPRQHAPDVFRTGFLAVWHLDDANGATSIKDATGTTDGTPVSLPGSMMGMLGSGFHFDGGVGEITFANPLSGATPHTISAWVDQKSANGNDVIMQLGTPGPTTARWFDGYWTTGTGIGAGFSGTGNDFSPSVSIVNQGFKLVHWVSKMDRHNQLFIDGVQVGADFVAADSPATSGTIGHIGNAPVPDYGTSPGMNGTLDEVRIANVPRTPGWILTEFKNQSSPMTFYNVGDAVAE